MCNHRLYGYTVDMVPVPKSSLVLVLLSHGPKTNASNRRVGDTYRKICCSTDSPTEGQICLESQAFGVITDMRDLATMRGDSGPLS